MAVVPHRAIARLSAALAPDLATCGSPRDGRFFGRMRRWALVAGRQAYDLAMNWQVYLSGEIHTDWRERIERGAAAAGLDLRFTGPVTDHAASDAAGTAILGEQGRPYWNDHIGAGVNAIRTRTLIERADVVVVRFGEQYRQWNAAFDAGYAAALGKPLITLHPSEHDHALKEVDRAALAVAREPEQVVAILRYALRDPMA